MSIAIRLETPDREAFELVTDALGFLDEYRSSKNVAALAAAKEKLASALHRDAKYFRACYYSAIVDELAGNSKEAARALTKLLEAQPPEADEVRYNLGVAEYHGYGHAALERAIEHFSWVIRHSGRLELQVLARAVSAQAHAMHIIPKLPKEPDFQQMAMHFRLAQSDAKTAIAMLPGPWARWFGKPKISTSTARDVHCTALNAKGMALMYYSDYFPPDTERGFDKNRAKALREAIAELDRANDLSPKDWANHCDMASARMRLGYYDHSTALWDEATELLTTVIEVLRPGYPFALYELGRIDRLRGNFSTAIALFDRVLSIPLEQRDISDTRPTLERDRAEQGDRSFP